MGYFQLVMSYEQRIPFATWVGGRERGSSIIDPCIIVAMYRKSVATLIDLRAFHKFTLTTGITNHLYFTSEEGNANLPCALIVHSKLIKSQLLNIFPLFSICQSEIHDNYNLMYIFYVIFCICEIDPCRHNRRDNNIPIKSWRFYKSLDDTLSKITTW